jgi:hypothetical protein
MGRSRWLIEKLRLGIWCVVNDGDFDVIQQLESAMAKRGNSLPGRGENIYGGARCESVAIGMLEQLLIAKDLPVTGEAGPGNKFAVGRARRRHGTDRFI